MTTMQHVHLRQADDGLVPSCAADLLDTRNVFSTS